MGVPIITERALSIDNKSGSPTVYTSLLVGGFDDLGAYVQATQELTGAADSRPVRKQTGFREVKSFKLQFEADVGGTPDPVDDFYVNSDDANPRTVLGTFNTTSKTWSFAIECNITNVKLIVDPGDKAITLVEVEFEPTGSETITYT